MHATVCRWWRSTAKLEKQLSGPALEVVVAVRAQLQDFQQHLPVIAALRNPGLRERHWAKISAAVGFNVHVDKGGGCCRWGGGLGRWGRFAGMEAASCLAVGVRAACHEMRGS